MRRNASRMHTAEGATYMLQRYCAHGGMHRCGRLYQSAHAIQVDCTQDATHR